MFERPHPPSTASRDLGGRRYTEPDLRYLVNPNNEMLSLVLKLNDIVDETWRMLEGMRRRYEDMATVIHFFNFHYWLLTIPRDFLTTFPMSTSTLDLITDRSCLWATSVRQSLMEVLVAVMMSRRPRNTSLHGQSIPPKLDASLLGLNCELFDKGVSRGRLENMLCHWVRRANRCCIILWHSR